MKFTLSPQIFGKKNQTSNFTEIFPVGAELFQTDGHTDRHEEADRRFLQVCEKRLKTQKYFKPNWIPNGGGGAEGGQNWIQMEKLDNCEGLAKEQSEYTQTAVQMVSKLL